MARRHVLLIATLYNPETDVSACVDLRSQILACSVIYERGDKTLPYGRKVPLTDPNQDANCQTDERMITATVTGLNTMSYGIDHTHHAQLLSCHKAWERADNV